MLSPTSDGAGAAVLANEGFVRKHGLEARAVEIIAQEMVTDLTTSFEENSCIKMVREVLKLGSVKFVTEKRTYSLRMMN